MNTELQPAPRGERGSRMLADLHQACFDDGWGSSAFTRILAMRGVYALVAQSPAPTSAVAFAVWRSAADEAEIITIGVLPAARRCGLARLLISAVEQQAAAYGAHQLFLEVADDNIAALELYRNSGYERVGRRQNYYRNREGRRQDAVIMARPLSVSGCLDSAPKVVTS